MSFDIAKFRRQFPEFDNTAMWTDDRLEMMYHEATCYVWPYPQRSLNGDCLQLALFLMVAHLGQLTKNAIQGKKCGKQQTGIITQATISRVSVSVMAPPANDMWSYWLAQSPYGQRLLALLKMKSRGGQYIGGRPERSGFRKGGGVFW